MIDITVVVPSIPRRANNLLIEALDSVRAQLVQPVQTVVEVDTDGRGPGATRNRALRRVETPWVAFLDDDDLLHPIHLERLAWAQKESDADVLWPWFWVSGGTDPFPASFGRQWDPEQPHIFPITTLVRTQCLLDVGLFREASEEVADPNDPNRTVSGEDWDLWLRLNAAGARFHHLPERTWTWRHHGGNTSGLPARA